MNGKIHRARVTGSDLHYIGSITIDSHLLKQANILPFEKVQVINLNTGGRWETYAIEAPEFSGTVEINGGCARLAEHDDILIVISYVEISDAELEEWDPHIVMVDEKNRMTELLRGGKKGFPADVLEREPYAFES